LGLFRKSEEVQHEAVIEEYRRMISAAVMPQTIERITLQELEVLSKISPSSPEYTISLAYIDYLVSMPWSTRTEDNLDMRHAERILDEDHYGLRKIKERILEHLAVKVLTLKKKPKILIIDDEEIARRNLEHILGKENYDVESSPDGVDALRKIGLSGFDVVLTDLKMAGIDGMEILEKMKTRYPDTKVIMITGYATVQSAIEAMKKGAFDYIAKPFRLDEVRKTVGQALEKKSSLQGPTGSVFCFAGPPGTGKTSMGRSIARALGRKFVRISLAGMKDEAEIRGHRRTYAGAKPGRIIEEIRRCGSANPLMMLDEMDKIGRDFKGDPSSALLELLDSEQNNSFVDHYLDVPFDLSGVIFILTANVLDEVPAPLLDRMEVIEFSGYTQEEKEHIAVKFLIPRQIREKGLAGSPPVFTDKAIQKIIREYTREAGIRNLERKIAGVCLKIARQLVQGEKHDEPVMITPETLEYYLGRRKFHFEVVGERERMGVATGLVRTETGGDLIFVEAAKMKGKKELIITGSLGDVMKESALAAVSYIRSNAGAFGISEDFFEHHDIHIHVPSGAIQKDGPSAGITIAAALVSLLKKRPARMDAAMSGEITLTGRILPVSGIREKILAARRAGVRTVLLPAKNRVDVEQLPAEVRKDIEIIMVDTVEEVADIVLRDR
jgi:ATP-dependent Lon protease